MSFPTSFRLSDAGVAALKVLETKAPDKGRGDIISEALTAAVDGTPGGPPVKFNVLNPLDILLLRAEVAKLATNYQKMKADLLKAFKKPDAKQAEAVASTMKTIDAHLEALEDTDIGLMKMSLAVNGILTAADTEALLYFGSLAESAHIGEKDEKLIRAWKLVATIFSNL